MEESTMFWADRFDEGRICLLTLEGRLSRDNLENLAERLRGLAARGMDQVVVDANGVEHWDFRGLQGLADAVALRRRYGFGTAFITPSPYLKDIARAAGVHESLDFYDALDLNNRVELSVVEAAPAGQGEPLRQASSL